MLLSAFLSDAPVSVRQRIGEVDDPGLAARLQSVVDDAVAAWPEVEVAPDDFVRYVSMRLQEDAPADNPWTGMHLGDLYLACGCAEGSPRALSVFERTHGGDMRRAAARVAGDEARGEDFQQVLREKLFVHGDTPPKIREYSGYGPLRGWLRIVARRTYIDLWRRQGRIREHAAEQDELAIVATSRDLELDFLEAGYRESLRAALAEAMAALSRKQRTILRYHFAHKLSVTEVGKIYRVHRSTAGRWISEARAFVVERTREGLVRRLGAGDRELDSVLRALESRLEITMSAMLRSPL